MKLLTLINNNVHEWRQLSTFDPVRPRLPLAYLMGGSFLAAGHSVYALDLASKAAINDPSPFAAVFHRHNFSHAVNSVDLALLWGSDGLKEILRQAIRPMSRKNILYFSYMFAPEQPTRKQRTIDWTLRALAGATKGVVLMTGAQAQKARNTLGARVPVIRVRCGIDTAFYRAPASMADVPSEHMAAVEKLLREPYVILPGDELRFNDDALEFVLRTGIRLVRVSQYGHKSGTDRLKAELAMRRCTDRLLVFEKIGYPFLRFLLRNAAAYAGFVDSSWQPAGWTVACEALASGLPLVVYSGLVADELGEAGAPEELIRQVEQRNVRDAAEKLADFAHNRRHDLSAKCRSFAETRLDLSNTAPPFVDSLEALPAE
jgi:glycosyltransferase involved in cell wall biosynthesis